MTELLAVLEAGEVKSSVTEIQLVNLRNKIKLATQDASKAKQLADKQSAAAAKIVADNLKAKDQAIKKSAELQLKRFETMKKIPSINLLKQKIHVTPHN